MKQLPSLSTNQLRLSEDSQQLLLLVSHGYAHINAETIINLIKSSDYKSFKLNKDGLRQAIQYINENPNETSRKMQSFVVANRLDAQLKITISADELTAKALITSSYAGHSINYQQVVCKLKELNISVGISEIAIKQLLKKSSQAKPGTTYKITIAKGTKVVDGCDSYFECLLSDSPKEILSNSLNMQYGSVDMLSISGLISVENGQQLMRRHPARSGSDGMTVTGKVVKHTPAKDHLFEVGINTTICEKDKNILISTTQGIPVTYSRGMKVDPLLKLDSLNSESPKINHKGSLIITGDILDCTEIIATGDITVIGFIDSSNVECGGDLFVSKGILGHRMTKGGDDVSTHINCKGSLFANFIQYATVNVEHNLNIKYQVLHSHITSKGYINVKDDEGKKGAIFGGVISASKGICTVTLGAEAGIKTSIEIKGKFTELINSKERIEADTTLTKQKLLAAVNAQQKLMHIADLEKRQLFDERLMLTIQDSKNKLSKLQDKRKNNYLDRQEYFNNINVLVLKTMHSEVSIKIGDGNFHSTHNYGASKIYIRNEQLMVSPYHFSSDISCSSQSTKV